MYDFAHGQCDSIENITHSICTLEFDVHRPLYDWFIEKLGIFPSHQYEFARLNITHTVMSKRKLLELVRAGLVKGWDDPRMPTICGLRRRGYTPSSIRLFAEKVGVAKRDNVIDLSLMEWCIREESNKKAPRFMAVLDPVKVVITNYPSDREEYMKAPLNPEEPNAGERNVPFSRDIFIERNDFMEDPPKKFFRLRPGGEVRLKYGYIIRCDEVIKDGKGRITELHCSYDPASKPGTGEWRSVKGTIHWLSARHAVNSEIRLFDRLFTEPYMGNIPEDKDYKDYLNSESLSVVQGLIDRDAADTACKTVAGSDETRTRIQFERLGYFVPDYDTTPEKPVFNRICTLKDSFSKTMKS
jgi:glutaminyl-tRNA synthetase